VTITAIDDNSFDARGVSAAAIGEAAAGQQVVLHELSPQTGSLEDAFLAATGDAVDYRAGGPT
jgi:ABC-2 type transport system ATP-binding protein